MMIETESWKRFNTAFDYCQNSRLLATVFDDSIVFLRSRSDLLCYNARPPEGDDLRCQNLLAEHSTTLVQIGVDPDGLGYRNRLGKRF